jgi:hypothetical protein
MTPGLLALASVAVGAGLLWLPLRWAFALLMATLVLVPDTMRLPFGSEQLLLVRVAPLVFLAGLLLRARRGELARDAFRPTLATAGLIGFGVVAWLVGVIGADGDVPATFSRDAWLVIPDQVLVLVVVVAATRTIGSVTAALSLASAATAAGVIAVLERMTGSGYAELAFRHLPEQRGQDSGARLELRAGEVRPRVAARFALAYAWQAAMLLPLVAAAVSLSNRRIVRLVGVPVVVVAIVSTSTRSVYLGMAVGAGAFALLCGRRSIQLALLAFALVAFGLVVGTGAMGRAFEAPEVAGSNAVREERAPVVLDVVRDDPLTGLGYGALLSRGLPTTDSSWLQLYAELGAVGLAALVVSVAMALAAIGPALSGTGREPARVVAAACWAGVAISLLGAASFDLFTGRQSVLPLWALAGIGVVAGEELRPARRRVTVPRYRLALPLAGLVVGFAVFLATPRSAAVVADLQLVPVAVDATAATPDSFVGRTLATTTCSVVDRVALPAGVDSDCILPFGRGAGAARVRLSGGDGDAVEAAYLATLEALRARVQSAEVIALDAEQGTLPAPIRTAPLIGAVTGAVLALVPPLRRADAWTPSRPVVA